MERAGALISKLKEQYDEHATVEAIAMTAQMLLAELQLHYSAAEKNVLYKKVAVIMPFAATNVVLAKPELFAQQNGEATGANPLPPKTIYKLNWEFDEINDVPTLAHQHKEWYELNETIGDNGESSINEKLREEKTELANVLQEAPVKDLRKAIGINDRYIFINELFRGDETMYERSIKTINSFNILPEAEYWILRELKLKLAWNENSDAVALFDQVIRRRFS